MAEEGNPVLQLWDSNNQIRAVLGPTDLIIPETKVEIKRPLSSLVLFNEKGNVVWEAP